LYNLAAEPAENELFVGGIGVAAQPLLVGTVQFAPLPWSHVQDTGVE
jgi:hypothetical protein